MTIPTNGHRPPSPPAQPGPTVPIAAVPLVFNVGQAQGADGSRLVSLHVQSPMGVLVFLMDPDCAVATAQNLERAGRVTKTGLVLPGEASP